MLAGGAAISVTVTPWLLAFCIFFFLSLAFAKRYAELRRVQVSGSRTDKTGPRPRLPARRHGGVRAVGPASGYMAVLVLALYVNSEMA